MLSVKVLITNNKTHETEYLHFSGLYNISEINESVYDEIIERGWNIDDCTIEIDDDDNLF